MLNKHELLFWLTFLFFSHDASLTSLWLASAMCRLSPLYICNYYIVELFAYTFVCLTGLWAPQGKSSVLFITKYSVRHSVLRKIFGIHSSERVRTESPGHSLSKACWENSVLDSKRWAEMGVEKGETTWTGFGEAGGPHGPCDTVGLTPATMAWKRCLKQGAAWFHLFQKVTLGEM
jgi:hypothetical protein